MHSREKIMKKIIIAILAFAVLATGVIFAVAQRSGDDKKGDWDKRGGHHREIGMAFRALDLTDEQKTKVKEIMEANRTSVQPIIDALRANHEKMQTLTGNGAFDEAQVTALAAEQGDLSAKLIVEKQRVKSQVFAILTDAQKAKAAEMETKMRERFKNRTDDRTEGEKAPGGSEF